MRFYSFKDIIMCIWKKIIASILMFFIIYFSKKLDFKFFDNINYNLLIENVILIFLGVLSYLLVLIILRDYSVVMVLKKIRRKK